MPAINANVSLAAKYVGAGALVAVGGSATSIALDKAMDGDQSGIQRAAGVAGAAAGIGVSVMGFQKFFSLPWHAASGGNTAAKVALVAANLAAYTGASLLVNTALRD